VDRNVTRAPFDEAAWWARVEAAVPLPEYSTLTKLRETPGAPPALAIAVCLAVALSRPLRRRRG
jgi:hypothetical protein